MRLIDPGPAASRESGGRFTMITMRWRVRTLAGLVFVAALGIKGVLLVQSTRDDKLTSSEGRFALYELLVHPRPAILEPALVADLADPDAGVRHTAAWALDEIGSTSPALVPVLIGELETQTERSWHESRRDPEQIYPAGALKRMKLPAAVIAPRLRKAMASKDRWVRLQATEVLCDAAGRTGPPAPDLATLLLAALRDEEAAIRMPAPEALARLDGDARRRAVAILLEQLRGPDRLSELLAAIGLARFGPEGQEAVAILADRLEGGDVASRLLDLYLLGRLGPVAMPAVPAIVRAMTSPDAGRDVPFFWNRFLPRQDSWRSIDVGRILDPDRSSLSPFNLCSLGASVLGRIGPEAERQAVDILVGMLQGEDEPQRQRAADALGALGPKASAAFPTLLALAERKTYAWHENDESRAVFRFLRALEKICAGDDPRFVAALVRMLGSGDWTKRMGAAGTLRRLDPPAALAAPVLIGALKDETQGVRFSAAEALGRYEGPEGEAAVPALLDALQDGDDWIRIKAAEALARLRSGAGRAVPTLVGLLRSGDPSLRYQAATILGAFGPAAGPAIPDLRAARSDAEEFVRDAAEKALKAVAPPEAGG